MAAIKITNSEIYEWYTKLNQLSIVEVCESFSQKFKIDVSNCSQVALYNKITRLIQRIKLLRKAKKKKDVEGVFAQEFVIPKREDSLDRSLNSTKTEKEKSLVLELSVIKKKNKNLKRKMEVTHRQEEQLELVEQQYLEALNGMKTLDIETKSIVQKNKNDLNLAAKELQLLKQKFEKQSDALEKAEDEVRKHGVSHAKIRRLSKKIAYRDNKLKVQGQELIELRSDLKKTEVENINLHKVIERLNKKSEKLEEKLSNVGENIVYPLKAEKVSCQKKILYLKNKISKSNSVVCNNQCEKEIWRIKLTLC